MSYEFRKDNRTETQFKEDIGVRTEKENICTRVWHEQVIKPYSPQVLLRETGVGNDGGVIKEQAGFYQADFGLELNNPAADLLKLLKIEGEHPEFLHLEVKVSPSYKATIKEHNFRTYESYYSPDNFRMLVFIDTGRDIYPNSHSEWFIMKMEEFDIFKKYGLREERNDFGRKPTRMLGPIQLSGHFSLHPLFPAKNA